jgi:topoisomerase IA-like protein
MKAIDWSRTDFLVHTGDAFDWLDSEDQLFTLSLAEAKEMFAQPKTRGRGRVAAPPLRELGGSGRALESAFLKLTAVPG